MQIASPPLKRSRPAAIWLEPLLTAPQLAAYLKKTKGETYKLVHAGPFAPVIRFDSVSVVRNGDNAGTTSYTLDVTNHSWYGHALRSEPQAKAAAGRAMAKIALAGWLAEVLETMPPGAEANPTEDNAKADSLL